MVAGSEAPPISISGLPGQQCGRGAQIPVSDFHFGPLWRKLQGPGARMLTALSYPQGPGYRKCRLISCRCYENSVLVHRPKASRRSRLQEGVTPVHAVFSAQALLADLLDDPDRKNMMEVGLPGDPCDDVRHSLGTLRSAVGPDMHQSCRLELDSCPGLFQGTQRPLLLRNFYSGPKEKHK